MASERVPRQPSRTLFRVRVTVLLAVLAGVLLYAWRDVRQRRARNDWKRPMQVAFVLLRHGAIEPAAIDALRADVERLESRLAEEHARHRGSAMRPFELHVLGPIGVAKAAPTPNGDGLLDLGRHAYAQWRYVGAVDEALGLDADRFDARIYLVLAPPHDAKLRFVEGVSEQGGRVGVVAVDLDRSMSAFASIVAAHELFHTIGAIDHYDATGLAQVPDGLAEPERVPRYPQRYFEIMARGRPIAPGDERPPESVAELWVGAATAREIGWLPSTSGP